MEGLTRYKIIKGEQRRIIEQNKRLYEAASYGKTDIVKYLIEIGAEVDVSKALYAAAGNNHVECLGFLIGHGANIEEEEPRDDFNTALQRAVKTNSLNATQLLLKEGARIDKVDAKGRSMLMIAAEKGFSEMVKLLLQAGADANQHNHDKEKGETRTSLSCALAAGFPDAALLLLHGTDLSCSNILNPVLKYAAVLGHVGILKALLDKVGQNQTFDIMKSVKTILSYVIEFGNTDALGEILNIYKNRESIKAFLDDGQVLLTAVKTDKPDLLKILSPFINNEGRISNPIIEAIITRGQMDILRILNYTFSTPSIALIWRQYPTISLRI